MHHFRSVGLAVIAAWSVPVFAQDAPKAGPCTVSIRTRDGKDVEGGLAATTLSFLVDGAPRVVAVADLLSLHLAAPASASEVAAIERGLLTLAGKDFKANEAVSAELTDIGLPVLTPLLASYADTDAHEPDPRYRLFARLVPGRADGKDRSLDLIRLVDGTVLRGSWQPTDLSLQDEGGNATAVPGANVRRLAVRRSEVARTFELHALRHCTYIGWLDTGIAVTGSSALRGDAEGFVRLSFAEDGWAAGPDGLHDTLPGKRKLQEGFRWGAVLGRVGAGGERWLAGGSCAKAKGALAQGRLFFAVNDNEHWQNNIGSYRVHVVVSAAYDLGDPQ
ncbi:MAG: hypothetical protein WAT39_00800 [Planctomycetota bacterium]